MIVGRIQSKGRMTVPPEVCAALGVGPGDMLRYEIDGDRVFVTRGLDHADEHGGDLMTDAELGPIIDAALARVGEPTYSGDEVFAEVRAHLESLRGRADAA